MNDSIIKTHTSTKVIIKDIAIPAMSAVRVYKQSPTEIALQIRSTGPVAESGRGVSRVAYSHANLTIAQARQLLLALQEKISAAMEHSDKEFVRTLASAGVPRD